MYHTDGKEAAVIGATHFRRLPTRSGTRVGKTHLVNASGLDLLNFARNLSLGLHFFPLFSFFLYCDPRLGWIQPRLHSGPFRQWSPGLLTGFQTPTRFFFFISLSFAGVILQIKCCHHCVTLLKIPSFHLHRLLYVLYCILHTPVLST